MGLTVLDASVLIAALDADDAHHPAALEALRERRAAKDRLVVPASAYAEVLVGPLRRGSAEAAVVDDFLAALPAEVVPLGRPVALAAAKLRARHPGVLRLPDAFVLGTAVDLGADRVVTADHRWARVEGIAVEVLRS